PTALLVSRDDLHPKVVELILKTARTVGDKQMRDELMDEPNRFPTLDGVREPPPHSSAEAFMTSGESFLTRLLPYWAVRMVWQMRLLILPLLAVWLPFLKILPMIYNYRVSNLLKQHYTALRDVEGLIAQADRPDELRDRLKKLESLRKEMES